MPVNVSVQPLTSRFAVSPQAGGGYGRVSRPDPNDAMALYLQSHAQPVAGPHTSFEHPVSAMSPAVTNTGESSLSANLALLDRARQNRQAFNANEGANRIAAGNTGIAAVAPLSLMPMDRRFDALLQALSESGATGLKTGAAKFHDAPGFFDVQNPDAQGQQQRADYLRSQDVSRLMDTLRTQRGMR